MSARRRPVAEQLPAFDAEHVAMTDARAAEYVPTPPWVVRALVEGMAKAGHPPLPWEKRRIETGAGTGAIVDAVNALVGQGLWTLCELRAEAVGDLRMKYGSDQRFELRRGDYVALGSGHAGDHLWITNPAYSIAAGYLRKNLEEAAGVGTVALHVPWAFVATDAVDGVALDLYPIEGRPYAFVRETCWIVAGLGRGGRRKLLRKP